MGPERSSGDITDFFQMLVEEMESEIDLCLLRVF